MAVTKRQNKAKKAENKNASEGLAKLGAKEYELASCTARWSSCSFWVVDKGLKVVVVFEGGGKGGVIEAITERVSPRVFRVVALPALAKRENTRIYAPPGPALFPVSVLHAHKGIVDRGRLIKPMARIAVCGLAARRPAVRIEGELVMPHRHYVTLRAFRLDGRVRRRLRGRRNP